MSKRARTGRIFCGSLFLVFLLYGGFRDVSFAQPRLDTPSANAGIKNAVPMPLIKHIALAKSRETWGAGALGEPVPLADLNGDVIVYMFPYRIGRDKFPDYDEILAGISEGRELQNTIKNSGLEKARDMYAKMDHKKPQPKADTIVSQSEMPGLTPMPSVRPDGSISEKNEWLEVNRFAAGKAIGADEFGTILVSAGFDDPPVPAYFHFLAPYYTNFDLALEKAEQELGQGASLRTIYFMGLEGQYLEFANDGGTVIVHGQSLEKKSPDAFMPSRGPVSPAQSGSVSLSPRRAKMKADIAAEWEKFRSEMGGE